jgi:hypothetical protein
MSGATEDGERTRTWRRWGDVADIFSGPADPDWDADRKAITHEINELDRLPGSHGENSVPPAERTPATSTPRRVGQLQDLSVPDPLPDAEIAAWEDDSPS